MNIGEAIRWGASQLTDSESPVLDARVLLSEALEASLTYLLTWPDKAVTGSALMTYKNFIQQRASGQPVAYITGQREFWSLRLKVSPDTLIPRPDTETLVEQALARLPATPCRICDLGTGTGAIALALASERPQDTLLGVDRIAAAVTLARENARRNNIDHAQFMQSSWFDELAGQQFDMIVTNPPYVESHSDYLSVGDVRFEPISALIAGSDGLSDIRKIIAQAPAYLNREGWLLIEHGYTQSEAVQQLLRQAGFTKVTSEADLAGQLRITCGQMSG
ncbi:peptide chain release factor N(5)-glutamine methyltransferase [Salinimonas marina]|uniref:Release factor glutamine methyltransferase n=1 Tax=Salinimonas marina TaxID=2785918 RepID=A0A7S9HC14_9ALTE|nr:peptide chain release factor N(5)-glutamine methyltransferase [Salinimonas marina]QPG04654.1 peptide chain release factor N(5)-glutamine methyltransferase [Salinimonas marina]